MKLAKSIMQLNELSNKKCISYVINEMVQIFVFFIWFWSWNIVIEICMVVVCMIVKTLH